MLVFDTYEDEGRGKKGRSWMLEVDGWRLEVEELVSLETGKLESWEVGRLECWEGGR